MINYTPRLDKAIRKAAWAHEQAKQHRKGSEIPYIIHPFGVLIIASNATDDEDVLIACLMHDVLEDVESSIYSQKDMQADFGDRVVSIVLDVTKNELENNWHTCSNEYLHHLEYGASDEAVIVSASDKIHNIASTLADYEVVGEQIWQRFSTKNSKDQLWWYVSILKVIRKRNAPMALCELLAKHVETLKIIS